MNKTIPRLALLGLFATAVAAPAFGLGTPQYVAFNAGQDTFPMVTHGKATPLVVDSTDWPGVARAARDLADDVQRVTGIHPALSRTAKGDAFEDAIIIGTIGKSNLIDDLVRAGKLDVAGVRGKWEAAVTTTVDSPLPGIKHALVIAGSDKRGTIFGIYDLSEQIGVSPWYWWADVRIPHHEELYVRQGRFLQPEPAVKYRGIFLNDEAPCLTGWTEEKFGGRNSKFYRHIFELLLRLKANYLWPAMWSSAFNEDDPQNPVLADEYGIVMGTSHHEPMLRSQQEWKRHGSGPWNYETNGDELRNFWRQGIERNRNFESTITLGMRGDGDKPMSDKDDLELLEKVVHDQLQILKRESTPTLDGDLKLWALYKEVQGYYEKGMRVPDDVMLLWSDDNWGNLRRLPTPEERNRRGGSGIYYHFDYVGGPRSYKWINTNPISRVWEQMHLALEYGADRLWIVNVGDLKPMEFPMEFFLDYARTPGQWDQDHLHQFAVDWAKRDFGSEHAEDIAAAIEGYTHLLGRRKPELLSPATFSISNFQEAARVEAEWDSLEKRVDDLAAKLPESEQASYFELVQYPVDAASTVTKMYIAAGENALAAKQGRVTTNDYAARTHFLFDRDQQLATRYNHGLLQGRWDHMMDQPHIGYTSWHDPPANIMPPVAVLAIPDLGALGVAVGDNDSANLDLGEFDSLGQQVKILTLFNKGKQAVDYSLKSNVPWVQFARSNASLQGTVAKQVDVPVHIDWTTVPSGLQKAEILASDGRKEVARISLTTRRQDVDRSNLRGFAESDGYIAIEAAHTSERSSGKVRWTEIPDFGRTLSGMTPMPVTAASDMQSTVAMSYRIHTYEDGQFNLELIAAPSMDFVPGRGLRLAISVDDGPRKIVDLLENHTDRDWDRAVSDEARIVDVPVDIASAGNHTLHVWYVDPGVVLERLVLSRHALPKTYLGPPESFHVIAKAQ